MKRIGFSLITFFLISFNLEGQAISHPVLLEVEGAISIGHTDNPTPAPGTIRYSGGDFEGYTGEGWISLTGIPYLVDIDNNRYEIVKIGEQVWMAENLRVTRYNDGTPVSLITDPTDWNALTSPAYTWYENGPSDYGALYNWYTVADTNTHNICPVGWHVPSNTEWNTLESFLGSTDAGGDMKETGLEHWESPNLYATNQSGFTALPGGLRSFNGGFFDAGARGYWWSKTPAATVGAYYRFILSGNDDLFLGNFIGRYGMSVRCIKE